MIGPSQFLGCKIEVPDLMQHLLDRTNPKLAMTPQKRINIYIYIKRGRRAGAVDWAARGAAASGVGPTIAVKCDK